MGRRAAAPEIESRVRHCRLQLGLSQGELARRAGLTRQAISSIENGSYVPNTVVALRLAQQLHRSVEDLFALGSPSESTPKIAVIGDAEQSGRRLAVAQIADRWIGYPLATGWSLQQGFASADALLDRDGPGAAPTFLTPLDRLARTAVVLGCDPALGILASHLAEPPLDERAIWLNASSQAALDAVGRGETHVGGTHLHDNGGTALHARRALHGTGGIVVEFARWEQGLVVQPGNPRALHTVADLARSGVRIVNREEGSGSRALLDSLLGAQGIPSSAVEGYDRIAGGHLAATSAVASGGADTALALEASGRAFGLDFVPLDEIRFDLVIPLTHMSHPAVARLLEALQSGRLRAEVGALPGYNVRQMGTVHLQLSAESAAP